MADVVVTLLHPYLQPDNYKSQLRDVVLDGLNFILASGPSPLAEAFSGFSQPCAVLDGWRHERVQPETTIP
jgi:hypothetical protein